MCEYVKFNDKELPICSFNNELCTLCVLGKTKKFEEQEKTDESMQNKA